MGLSDHLKRYFNIKNGLDIVLWIFTYTSPMVMCFQLIVSHFNAITAYFSISNNVTQENHPLFSLNQQIREEDNNPVE